MIDRSLILNPSFARGWAWSALLRNLVGQPSLAIEHYKRSLRLSPRDRLGAFGITLGVAHFFNREFDDAAAILLTALEQAPTFTHTYRLLASCYANMGRLSEAPEIVNADHPDKLIVDGAFAFSRNPIYVAFSMVLIGEFLIFPNWIILIYLGAAMWLFHRQVLREEEYLKRHYGRAYEEYCHRVRRYF